MVQVRDFDNSSAQIIISRNVPNGDPPSQSNTPLPYYPDVQDLLLLVFLKLRTVASGGLSDYGSLANIQVLANNNALQFFRFVTTQSGTDGTLTNFALEGATGGSEGDNVFARTGLSFDTSTVEWLTIGIHHRVNHATAAGTMRVYLGRPTTAGIGSSELMMLDPVDYDIDGAKIPDPWSIDPQIYIACPMVSYENHRIDGRIKDWHMMTGPTGVAISDAEALACFQAEHRGEDGFAQLPAVGSRDYSFVPMNSGLTPATNWDIAEYGREPVSGWDRQTLSGPLGWNHLGCIVVRTPTTVDDPDFAYYAGGDAYQEAVDGVVTFDGAVSTQVTPADAFTLDLVGQDWFTPREIGAGAATVQFSGTWEGAAPPTAIEYRIGSGGAWQGTIENFQGSAPSGTWTATAILAPGSFYAAPNDEQLEFRAVFAGGPTGGELQDEFSVGVAVIAWGGPNVGGRGDPPYKSWTDIYDPAADGGLRAHQLTRDAVGFQHPVELLAAPHGTASGGIGHSDGDDQGTYGTTAVRSIWNYVAGYILAWYGEPVCIIAVGQDPAVSLAEMDKRSFIIAPSSAALGTEWEGDPATGNDDVAGWRTQTSGETSWQELIHCAEQVFGIVNGTTNRIPTGYPSKGDPGALEVPGTTDNLKDTFIFALWVGEADANPGQAATPDTFWLGASTAEAGLQNLLWDIDFDFPTTPVVLATIGDGAIEGSENNIRESIRTAWAQAANAYPGPSLYDLETPGTVLEGEMWIDEAAQRWATSILDATSGVARFTFDGMTQLDRTELLLTFSHDLIDPIRDPIQPRSTYDGIRVVDGVELVPDTDYTARYEGGPYVVLARGMRELFENFDTGTEGGQWSTTDPEGTGPLWGPHEGDGFSDLREPENGSGDLVGHLEISGSAHQAGGVRTISSKSAEMDIHTELIYILDQRVSAGAALRCSGAFNETIGTWATGYHIEADVINSATGFWRIYDAAANLLAEFPMQGTIPWVGTHFHTRFRISGGGSVVLEIFGRSWLDGDPEPDVWDFQWVDPDDLYPDAGDAGIFIHKPAGGNVTESVDLLSITATVPQFWDQPTVSMGWNRYADGKTVPRAGVSPGAGSGGFMFNANAPPEPILDVPVGHIVIQPYGIVQPAGEVRLEVGLKRLDGTVWPNGGVQPASDSVKYLSGALGPGGDVTPIASRKTIDTGTLSPAGQVSAVPSFGSAISVTDQPNTMQLWPRLVPVVVAGTWAGQQPTGFEYRVGPIGAWQPIVGPTIGGGGTWSFAFSPGTGQFTDGTNGDGRIEIRANYPAEDSDPEMLSPFYVGIMLYIAGDSNGVGFNANIRAGYDEVTSLATRLSPIQSNFSGNPINTTDHQWIEETYEPCDARWSVQNLWGWEPATSELAAIGAQIQAGDPTDDGALTPTQYSKRSLATHVQGYIAEATGIPVGICNVSRSGASLYPAGGGGVAWGGWLKPTVGWDTRPNPNTGYEELVQRVEELAGVETGTVDRLGGSPPTDLHGVVEGVIMSCGSNDANYLSLPEATHRANIDQFCQDIDNDLGCPVFWEDPAQRTNPPTFDEAEMDKFRSALIGARDAGENLELVTMSYDIDLEANGGDGVHYGSITNRITADLPAERVAVALLHYIEGAGPTASPRIARLEIVDVADVECQFDEAVLMPANNGGISVFEGGNTTPLVEGVDYSIAHAGDTLTITRIGGPLWSEPVWVSFGELDTPEGQGLYDGQNPQNALNVPYATRALSTGFTGAGPMTGQTYTPVEWAYRVPASSLLPTFVNVSGAIAPAGQFDRVGAFGRGFGGGLGPGQQDPHPFFAIGKGFAGDIDPAGIETLLKGLGITVTGSIIINGIVTGQGPAGGRLVGGQLLPAGTVTFSGQYGRQFAGDIDPAGAARAGAGRTITGILDLAGTMTGAGAVLVFVEGQLDPVGVIVNRQVAIALAGQVVPSGLFGRLGAFGRTVGGLIDPDGRLFKALPGLKLGGVLDPAGYVNLGDIYAPVAVDAKSIAHRAQVHTLPEEED